MKVNKYSYDSIGRFSILLWVFSFFFISGGLYYSVWLGLGVLLIKIIKKEKIILGNKKIMIGMLFIYFGAVISDVLNFEINHNKIQSIQKYSHLLMYFVFINFIKTREDIKLIFKLLIVSLLGSYLGTVQHWKEFGIDPYYRMESFYDVMRYGHILSGGLTMLLGYILFYEKKEKNIKFIIMYLIGLIILFLNKTRGAILDATICQGLMMAYYIYNTKKIKLILMILVIGLISFSIMPNNQRNILVERFKINGSSNSSNKLRLAFWEASWNGVKENPVKGVGYRGVKNYFTEFFKNNDRLNWVYESYGNKWEDPHSSYMSMFIRHGFFMGIYFIVFSFFIIPQIYINYLKKISIEDKPYYLIMGFVFLNFIMSGLTETTISVKEGNLFVLSISIIMFLIKNSKSEEKSEESF